MSGQEATMALIKDEIVNLYRKRAKHYDFTANLYYLVGFREQAYRKKAVRSLSLKTGDTVVEVGCGTGLNFPMLQEAIGREGKIIGVDLTDDMLTEARNRIKANNWTNVELVHMDAAKFQFPAEVGGIISTFAITLIPEFDLVIGNGCKSLEAGRRLVILDFKLPSNWLSHLEPLLIFLTRPFGVTKDLAGRHPWESVNYYMGNMNFKEYYGGIVYISVGEKREGSCP